MSTAAVAGPAAGKLPLEDWRPPVNPWIIAVVVTLATFMEVLDTSIANVALPHVAGNLSASVDEATWVLTSYLVANAIVLPLNAWFSMLIGRKRFYMMCVALFTASSALCGLAPNLETLVFFRVLQGIGGGGLQPSEQAILVDTFPREKRAMAMAAYGIAVVVAPILGPTLGGWITDNYSWRWIFFINVPVGIISLLLTSELVSDPPFQKRKTFRDGLRIDYIGFGFIALGLGFLQVFLDKGQREDWFESRFIVICAVLTVVGIVAAVFWELRQDEPMVDFRLLKDRNFATATLLMFMLGFVLYGSTMLLPVFMQTMLGYTATWSGLALSPGGLFTMMMMPIVGILASRFQARWLVTIGLIVVGTALLGMAGFSTQIDFRTAMYARVHQAIGLSFMFLPINTVAYAYVPRDKNNNAAGLINLARNIGGSVGIAFTTTMLARRAQFHQNVLSAHVTPYDDAFQSTFQQASQMLSSAYASSAQVTEHCHALIYRLLGREANMLAFVDCFWLLGVMFLSMIPLVFLLKKNIQGKA
ncbi:MAG TPA: DHA2 family efflux MFS transporter permease subunit [Tepidisphaeraceae bacterium]|nr:DHA2 family efflux MFS transporter permease subunit [Tepidisphaeraceae bacterium]